MLSHFGGKIQPNANARWGCNTVLRLLTPPGQRIWLSWINSLPALTMGRLRLATMFYNALPWVVAIMLRKSQNRTILGYGVRWLMQLQFAWSNRTAWCAHGKLGRVVCTCASECNVTAINGRLDKIVREKGVTCCVDVFFCCCWLQLS